LRLSALFKRRASSSAEEDAPAGRLLAEIGDLDTEQRVAVARGLALLWEAMRGRFGGLDGFLESSEAERAAYVRELQSAAERMIQSEALTLSRYALSPTLMALYLDGLVRRPETETAVRFGRAVAELIEQGTKLRRPNG
jgi:hypothetical protein